MGGGLGKVMVRGCLMICIADRNVKRNDTIMNGIQPINDGTIIDETTHE